MAVTNAPGGGRSPLDGLAADNRFGELPERFYTRLAPTPLPAPWLVDASPDAAALIGLAPDRLDLDGLRRLCAGEELPEGADPLAMVYAGHQFGGYVPRLGDGRAILLVQIRAPSGELWDLQLKGAGLTPYSRFADGRAVLRSCIREFLASEAMAALGIPTTRALAVVGSGLEVQRETVEPGAAMIRLARSHVRFGHFEYFYYRQDFDAVRMLADHVIAEHHPDLRDAPGRYRRWLRRVSDRTARLIARWQGVGFVHGVMNTDNMSVQGDTIDYGPFAFMEAFTHDFCPNHTDHGGRYAYSNQGPIGQWNVSRLLQACLPLLADSPEAAVEVGTGILDSYEPVWHAEWLAVFRAKLGLSDAAPEQDDRALCEDLLARMAASGADFTNTFRALCALDLTPSAADGRFLDQFADRDAAAGWLERWRQRLDLEPHADRSRQRRMEAVNPVYVLRTHLARRAIERAEAGDASEVARLRRCLRHPFAERREYADYTRPAPDGGRGIVLSCSS